MHEVINIVEAAAIRLIKLRTHLPTFEGGMAHALWLYYCRALSEVKLDYEVREIHKSIRYWYSYLVWDLF